MKLALIGFLTVAAFGAGLFGVMALLPAPPSPEDAAAEADSLTAAQLLEEVAGVEADSLVQLELPDVALDSIATLREQLTLAQAQIPTLLARLGELEQTLQARADRLARAQALGGTLGRLEDAELRALLTQLDADVLADVYAEASPRNRVKLLQALPSRRGAALVERIAAGDRRPIPVETPPAAPPPASADTAPLSFPPGEMEEPEPPPVAATSDHGEPR